MSFATKLMDLGSGIAQGFAEGLPVGQRLAFSRAAAQRQGETEKRIATAADRTRIQNRFTRGDKLGAIEEAEALGFPDLSTSLRAQISSADAARLRSASAAGAKAQAGVTTPGPVGAITDLPGQVRGLQRDLSSISQARAGMESASMARFPQLEDPETGERTPGAGPGSGIPIAQEVQAGGQLLSLIEEEKNISSSIDRITLLSQELSGIRQLGSFKDADVQVEAARNAFIAAGGSDDYIRPLIRRLRVDMQKTKDNMFLTLAPGLDGTPNQVSQLASELEISPTIEVYSDMFEEAAQKALDETVPPRETAEFNRQFKLLALLQSNGDIAAIGGDPGAAKDLFLHAAEIAGELFGSSAEARLRLNADNRVAAAGISNRNSVLRSLFLRAATDTGRYDLAEFYGVEKKQITHEFLIRKVNEIFQDEISTTSIESEIESGVKGFIQMLKRPGDPEANNTAVTRILMQVHRSVRIEYVKLLKEKGYNFDPETGVRIQEVEEPALPDTSGVAPPDTSGTSFLPQPQGAPVNV